MTPIMKRNTVIPVKSEVFSTARDNQTTIPICVYEGGRTRVKDNNLLGKSELTGIPPSPRGVPLIEVTPDVDANSITNVSASKRSTGRTKVFLTNHGGGPPKEEMKRIMIEAEKYKEADKAEACVYGSQAATNVRLTAERGP